MNKKRCFLTLCAAIMGFSSGFGLVYARVVPGWDRPWDPPNYYDPVSISWADTANPSFFYRDLGWQGGNVIDITRVIKSQLFGSDILEQLAKVTTRTTNKEIDTTPFSSSVLNDMAARFKGMENATESATVAVSIDGNSLFRQPNGDEFESYDPSQYEQGAQAKWLSDTYLDMAQAAESAIRGIDGDDAAIQAALLHSSQAEGALQAAQAQRQMEAVLANSDARGNALLADLLNLQSAVEMERQNEELKEDYEASQVRAGVADPYDEAAYAAAKETNGYERPEPPGMPDFE